MALSETDLKAIRAVVVDVLGGERILMPNETNRFGNQGVVNSVWHATGGSAKLVSVLIEARDQARKAAGATTTLTDADLEAIADAVADEQARRLNE